MRAFVVCIIAIAAVAAVQAQDFPALSDNEVLPGQRMGAWESDRPVNETALKLGYPSTVYGVDISQSVSTSEFACLKAAGLTFAIMRAWRSYGAPDPNAPGTVAAAWAAGLSHVDVYMFPCYSCGNPSGQVQQLITFLSGHGVRYGMIWLDIEGAGVYWSSNQIANRAFFEALRNEVVAQGKSLGIYSSASQWNPIFGSSYTGGSAYPLWYAHYDGQPSFGDFQPFGGWGHPNMKQFSDQGAKCGASYDINWYPA